MSIMLERENTVGALTAALGSAAGGQGRHGLSAALLIVSFRSDEIDRTHPLATLLSAANSEHFLTGDLGRAVAEPFLATFRLDPVRAVPLLDAAIGLFAGGPMAVALRGCRAYAYLHGGQWDEAEREAASVLAEPNLSAVSRVVPMSVLGLLGARRGRGQASTILDSTRSLLQPDVARPGPLPAALAEAAWLAGDDSRAIAEARRPLAGAGQAADPWQAGALACWVHRAGGTVPDVPVARPFALELAGDWAGAAAAFERRGLPYEAALARLSGDVDAVRAALATFTALGAEPAVRRARHRLRELGARRGTRPPWHATRANAFGLTSRQLEIACLLGEGLTNAQIAARLVISRYTVNHHVAAILAKLNVRNRAHAAGVLGAAAGHGRSVTVHR